MHEYTVELRIQGADLIPSAITEDLGLEPAQVRNIGDRRDLKTGWEEALWAYDGYPPSLGNKTWNSLDDGLRFVLEKLWPVKDRIDNYKSRFKVMLWCGHFYSTFNGGPTLTPSLLKMLGEFGVEVFIDTHFFDEDEPLSPEQPDSLRES